MSEHSEISKCKLCDKLLSHTLESSHLLSCGHVICVSCRQSKGQNCGRVLCSICKKLTHSFNFPTSSEIGASPTIRPPSHTNFCPKHFASENKTEIKCSCGENICIECAKTTHGVHYNYADMITVNTHLDKEMKQLTRLKMMLLEERGRAALRKRELEKFTNDENDELASKFTRIIAQAISRFY
ncbi:hypothetical protein PFISCL1PPCAC_21562, partial [Pristionchus fissidentatus]